MKNLRRFNYDPFVVKAKRLNSGEWIEGFLTVRGWGENTEYLISVDWEEYLVDKNTICKSIGKRDCNKRIIFERDIVVRYEKDNATKYIAFYDEGNCTFGFYDKSGAIADIDNVGRGFFKTFDKVVGNLLDNAEKIPPKRINPYDYTVKAYAKKLGKRICGFLYRYSDSVWAIEPLTGSKMYEVDEYTIGAATGKQDSEFQRIYVYDIVSRLEFDKNVKAYFRENMLVLWRNQIPGITVLRYNGETTSPSTLGRMPYGVTDKIVGDAFADTALLSSVQKNIYNIKIRSEGRNYGEE